MINTLVVPVTVSESVEWYNIVLSGDEIFEVELGQCINVIDGDYYTGAYEVTPRAFTEIVLPTNGLVMTDDVTVHEVPYWETHNEDGITAYIASEV